MLFSRLFNKGISLVVAAFISQGCSNHFVQAVGPDASSTEETPDYFPLNPGYSLTYEISTAYGSSELISYTVGRQVSFQGGQATEWINSDNGRKDTSYFVLNGSSLIFYEGIQSAPEVILDLPLAVGKSWDRHGTPGSKITDTTIRAGDIIIIKDSTGTNNESGLSSSFLTEGRAIMTIDKIESIELNNGRYYSGVYRVSNDAGANTRNFYWYAPGVGLIKYVLGAVESENPSGGVGAELLYYGYN